MGTVWSYDKSKITKRALAMSRKKLRLLLHLWTWLTGLQLGQHSPDNIWLHACMMCSCNAGRRRSAGPARWVDWSVARLPITPRLMKASKVGIRPSSLSGVMCSQSAASPCYNEGRKPCHRRYPRLIAFLLADIPHSTEFNLFKALDGLINGWCERRALRPLGYLLPVYPGVLTHINEQFQLLEALKNLKRLCRDYLHQSSYGWSRMRILPRRAL